ncbi:nucleoside hydrolase [Haloarcula litorea]|uniref:nucleoside hydrolase n=1 Tax=Haloarcula litorea TaxID=3032579 RepID=UPI0023E81693|nr:nucleoside hydrolase [Halomicroarcula sp. GDY20]
MAQSLIVDTDTASDDAVAILLAALADTVELAALTVVGGNVAFDREVENAKYTLELTGRADAVPVYEGARGPLLKSHEHVEHVHGEGGLGGDLRPETGIASADGHGADAIVEAARGAPGEVSLACIGPLTNVAMALQREPDLDELLDEVWVMGGAANTLGNDTPAAEYNFWVDPDAAKLVVRELDLTLVDWGVTVRDGTVPGDELDRLAAPDTPYAEFFGAVTAHARSFARERRGVDAITIPDALAVACLLRPEIVTEADTYFVDVDEREGMTRGYSLVDELGITDGEPRTRLVEAVDGDAFVRMLADALAHGDPLRSA